jgi:hypothetical protein
VLGPSGTVSITLPTSANFVNAANGIKDAFHVGVINCAASQQVNIVSPDNKNINGVTGPLVLAAVDPGTFAILFWSNQIDAWVAMLGCCAGPT